MEIDPDKFKEFVLFTFAKFKEIETELVAHKLVLLGMKIISPQSQILESLEMARKNPTLHQQMNQKYDALFEQIRQHIDATTLSQSLEKWIREWKPSGPVN